MLVRDVPRMVNPVFVGRGAFSEVYRVKDAESGELLACKVLQNADIARREGEMLQALRHPIFPEYRGYLEGEDCQYLWMEYICGCNLKQYIRRRGSLSVKRAVAIIRELAEGLLFLHEQSGGIIYRDIKPENIMLQQDGHIRLIDVGCACMAQRGGYETYRGDWGTLPARVGGHSSQRGYTMAGSRGYAAPEQFIPGARIGVESDVYGLGSLLAYLLTGKEDGMILKSSFLGMRKGTIPRGLALLIQQMQQEKRQDRVPDMRFLLQKLAVYEEGRIWQRFGEECRAVMNGRSRAEVYYVENIRR